MQSDIDVIQWFFSREAVVKGNEWPIAADRLVKAKQLLDIAIAKERPAVDVMRCYELFAAAVGPTVMTAMLSSDDAFQEVNCTEALTPPSPGFVTLYVDPDGKRLLAKISLEWGIPSKFSIT